MPFFETFFFAVLVATGSVVTVPGFRPLRLVVAVSSSSSLSEKNFGRHTDILNLVTYVRRILLGTIHTMRL